jgi:AraC-like DNA-binding protein
MNSYSRSFADPDEYQAAVRGGDRLYSLLGRGEFHADLTDIEVGRLKLQRGQENLPRLAASGMPGNKVGVLLWPGNGRLPVVRGVQMRPGELLCLGLGMQSHHRTSGPNTFAMLTLDASDLAVAAQDLTGRDLAVTTGKVLRPPEHTFASLVSVVEAAIRVSGTTPIVFSSPAAAKGLEQALLQPMIACLQHEDTRREGVPPGRHAALAKRFEEAVEANLDRSLFSGELSRMIGVSERSLRKLCQEQMGISPLRFLALRRLHLARRALLRADRRTASVTEIAMEHGMWELGRFAVTYRSLFGESPSATLRRRPPA